MYVMVSEHFSSGYIVCFTPLKKIWVNESSLLTGDQLAYDYFAELNNKTNVKQTHTHTQTHNLIREGVSVMGKRKTRRVEQ